MRDVPIFLSALFLMLLTACQGPRPDVNLTIPVATDTTETIAQVTQLPLPTAALATDVPATATATDEPTATPTDTATATTTPLPTQTPTALPTAPPTWTPTPLPVNTPRPRPTDATIIDPATLYCVVGVEPSDILNIRLDVGADSEVVGTIPPFGQEVVVTGAGRSVGDSVWVPVDYFGRIGYVNAIYLARQEGTLDADPATAALEAMLALRDGDTEALASLIHPEKGIRFVPFTTISDENPQFSAEETAGLWTNESDISWGFGAGTGDEILLTFQEFYERFLFSADYFYPDAVGYNTNISQGGAIDNSREIYPDAHIVEYHFDGFDPQFEGLDFVTLRIVVEQFDGQYYTTAIVHNAWTP